MDGRVLRKEQDDDHEERAVNDGILQPERLILEGYGEHADCYRPHQRKRKPHALPSDREGLKAKDVDIDWQTEQGVGHPRDGDDRKIPQNTKPYRPIREICVYFQVNLGGFKRLKTDVDAQSYNVPRRTQ